MPQMNLRLSKEQKEAWTKRATEEGIELSALIRQTMDSMVDHEAVPPSPAVQAANEQIARIAKRETARKAPGKSFSPNCENPRCARLNTPLCTPCAKAVALASDSAAEAFGLTE